MRIRFGRTEELKLRKVMPLCSSRKLGREVLGFWDKVQKLLTLCPPAVMFDVEQFEQNCIPDDWSGGPAHPMPHRWLERGLCAAGDS